MLERVLIAGAGGQGIVLMGRLLASVAVKTVPHVTFYPAYGAEVRGGTSHCQVILSSGEIDSPVSEEAETMIILNQLSLDRFLPPARPDTLLVLNASLCRPPAPRSGPVVCVPATELADEIGDARAQNFVMLGAYLQHRPVVPPADVEAGIAALLADKGPAVAAINLRAFRAGMDAARAAPAGAALAPGLQP